jgi:heme oxygenase
MKTLMSPTVTLSDYQKVIERLAKSFALAESKLGSDPTFLNFWQYEKKLPLLNHDLQNLNAPPVEVSSVHSAGSVNLHEKVGIIYVLQGSSLGGRFIAKHIAQKLNLDQSSGLEFYLSSQTVLENWKNFKNQFNEKFTDHPTDFSKVLASARTTFAIFINCFES